MHPVVANDEATPFGSGVAALALKGFNVVKFVIKVMKLVTLLGIQQTLAEVARE